jgi:hypothetical protein
MYTVRIVGRLLRLNMSETRLRNTLPHTIYLNDVKAGNEECFLFWMLAMAAWRFRAERCFGIRGPGEDVLEAQSLGYEELGLVSVGLVRVNEALESFVYMDVMRPWTG